MHLAIYMILLDLTPFPLMFTIYYPFISNRILSFSKWYITLKYHYCFAITILYNIRVNSGWGFSYIVLKLMHAVIKEKNSDGYYMLFNYMDLRWESNNYKCTVNYQYGRCFRILVFFY